MNRMFSVKTMTTVGRQLKLVQDRIRIAASKRPQHLHNVEPSLLAVSKTKGVDMIIDAYDAGQRHFGENYVVELHDKANDIELQDRCDDIRWHFIGHLQRNKVSKVLDSPNLYMVETVDSEKLAKALNDTWGRLKKDEPLRVMAQCNTSREENKSGCAPEGMVQLTKFIVNECPHIRLSGVMTIGALDFDYSKGPNPDFQSLISVREDVSKALDIPVQNLELSMGMSGDFEQAIEAGSSLVRVGSLIFGPRGKPKSGGGETAKDSQSKDESSTNTPTDSSMKDNTQQKYVSKMTHDTRQE